MKTAPTQRRRGALAALAAIVILGLALAGGAWRLAGRDAPPTSTADEPYYASTQDLEAKAQAVIRATIRSATGDDRHGYPETTASADVRAIAKGSLAVGQPIALSYTTPGSGPETADLKVGGEYVLLLELDGSNPAHLINSTQGWYQVTAGRAVAGPSNDVKLSPAVKTALGLA